MVIKKDFRIGVSLKAEARHRASAFNDTIGELVDWQVGKLLRFAVGTCHRQAAIDKLRQRKAE